MKIQKTIIITGTHHTPAIELIQLLKNDPTTDWIIHYVSHQYSTDTHILHTIIPKLNVTFHNLDCGKFNRKDLPKTIINSPKTLSAVFQSIKLINRIKPHIVVSFGGYVSVPIIIAANINKIPSITHEQTLTNSLATRINSFFVNKIALSFDIPDQIKELPKSKIVVTGNLIRQQIFDTSSVFFRNLKLDIKNFPLIYITGGNQGSEFLNNLIYQLIPKLSDKFTIIHQTGKNINSSLQSTSQKNYPNYHPHEYIEIEDIGWVLNNSKIIISRSGANICQEIDLLNKNSILIPLPFTQQNEQIKNAQWLQLRHPHTTQVIFQDQATDDKVYNSILTLSAQPSIEISKPTTTNQHSLLTIIHELT